MNNVVIDWNERPSPTLESANKQLNISYQKVSKHSGCREVIALKRCVKAREFFTKQARLNEDEIYIPRWFHATNEERFQKILESKFIKPLCRRNYFGAWVSSQREGMFGSHVFGFDDGLEAPSDTNRPPLIEVQGGQGIRWRGSSTRIPLKSKKVIVGVPNIAPYDRMTLSKIKVQEIMEKFQSKERFEGMVLSIDQVDYMRDLVVSTLGTVHLSSGWWSKQN